MLSALVLISSIAGAVLTAPVCVFALSAGGIQSTIASIIISLMLQCGVAPVNTNYLNTLNTSYGYTIESAISQGLLTETASGLVDSGLSTAIEGASAYAELGLGDIFTTTATDAGVIAASGGVNIANTAINVGNGVYQYNEGLEINENAFDIYRNTFAEFGQGIKTGIDLPNESLGYMGTSTVAGHLFDFSIGQYDTYTPIELTQYMSKN